MMVLPTKLGTTAFMFCRKLIGFCCFCSLISVTYVEIDRILITFCCAFFFSSVLRKIFIFWALVVVTILKRPFFFFWFEVRAVEGEYDGMLTPE